MEDKKCLKKTQPTPFFCLIPWRCCIRVLTHQRGPTSTQMGPYTAIHNGISCYLLDLHHPATCCMGSGQTCQHGNLSDWRYVIHTLQSSRGQLEQDTQHLLSTLSQHIRMAVQRIPAHCGCWETRQKRNLPVLALVWNSQSRQSPTLHFKDQWASEHNPPSHNQMLGLKCYQQTACTAVELRDVISWKRPM